MTKRWTSDLRMPHLSLIGSIAQIWVSSPRTAISESAASGNIDKMPIGKCTTPSRPGAPEGGAQGRATILPGRSQCRFGSLPFPPYRLRGCGCRCHRNHIFAVIAAGWCPGGTSQSIAERLALMACHALVPPWTTPGVPRVRGTAPAWSGSNSWPRPGGAQRPRPLSGGPSAAGCAHRGD